MNVIWLTTLQVRDILIQMKKFNFFFSWIPLAAAVSLLSLLIYGAVQQAIRLGANNPQIQMAEDAAMGISHGASPEAVLPSEALDMATSLAPYLIVYNDQGNVLVSSVHLDEKVPMIPPGVLAQARGQETRVTWQPKAGVRSAVVVVRYVGDKQGFVLAGRSLREVEKLEDVIFQDVLLGWAVTMVATFIASYLFRR